MQIVHTQYLRLKEKVNILYSFTQSLNLLSISYSLIYTSQPTLLHTLRHYTMISTPQFM